MCHNIKGFQKSNRLRSDILSSFSLEDQKLFPNAEVKECPFIFQSLL